MAKKTLHMDAKTYAIAIFFAAVTVAGVAVELALDWVRSGKEP